MRDVRGKKSRECQWLLMTGVWSSRQSDKKYIWRKEYAGGQIMKVYEVLF